MARLDEVMRQSAPRTDVLTPGTRMRLGDAAAIPREKNVDFSEGVTETSDEQVENWEKKGTIGYIEQLRRQDKTEMIPFNPEGAIKSVKLLMATNRLRDEQSDPKQKALDEALVSNYLDKLEEERVRGFSIGGRIAQGQAQIPSFMIEFIATGGLAAVGRKAIRRGAKEVSEKIAKEGALKMATRNVKKAVGISVFRTAAMPHRITENFAERQLNAGLELTEKGIALADEIEEKPTISSMKAVGDVFIENLSEVTGPALSKGAGYLIPRRMKSVLERTFKKLRPNESVKKLWTKAGYNGFLEELGEERVGDLMRALTGIEDFGAENPDQVFDRIIASIPNGEELLVEAGVLSVPGALRMSTTQIVDMIQRRKNANKDHVEPEFNDVEDEEIDQILGIEAEAAAAEPETPDREEAAIRNIEAAQEILNAQGFPQDVVDSIEAMGNDITEIENSVRDAENAIADGKSPEDAFRESFGAEVPTELTDRLAKAGDPSELPTEEGDVSFDAEQFEADEIAAAKESLQVGTEGVQIPESMILREARRLRNQAIEEQVPSRLEQFIIDSSGIRAFDVDPKTGKSPLAAEFKTLPKRFKSRAGQLGSTADQVADAAIEAGVVPEGTQGGDLIQMLTEIGERPKPPSIASLGDEAEAAARTKRAGFRRVQPGIKKDIRKATGQIKGDIPTITEFQALRESLRLQAKTARETAKMTKEEIEAAQKSLRKTIKESGINPNDRDKLTGRVIDVQNQQQLQAVIPDVQARINELIQASAKRITFEAIQKQLRTIKPRRISGRLTGRFTPEIQEALTRMRAAEKLTQAEAEVKLMQNLNLNDAGNARIPGPVTALENMMLNAVASRDTISNENLQEVLDTIQKLKAGGKQARELKQLKEQAQIEENRKITTGIVDSRLPSAIPTTGMESADDTAFGWYNRATAWFMGWNNVMNRLSWNDKSTTTNQSELNKLADVSVAETNEKKGLRLNFRKIRKMWTDAFGPMNSWKMEKQWAKDSVRESLGIFKNERGQQVNLFISKAEARKRWMEMQDPSLHETIFSRDGMAWTQEMAQAVEGFLSPADLMFAQSQMDFYRKYYDGFNDVYSSINGINLPENKFYSPIRRDVKERDSLENELLGELVQRRSLTPSAGKARVKNIRALLQINDTEIIQRHVQQVEHYKAWAEKIRQLNGIFNAGDVREAIEANFGKSLLGVVDRTIQDFTRGGIDRSNDSTLLNVIKNNYTVSVLSGKAAISIKQLMSFPAFADSIPTSEFVKGVLDLSKNFKKKVGILQTSEVMRSRGFSLTPEMEEAVNSKEWKTFQLSPTLRNKLLLLTRLGDRGAIFLGGWSVYRYHKTVLKKSHSEAIKAFEDALSSSQQSADLSQTTQFQRGNSFQRLFAVFLSAPNQYFRKELAATDDMVAGRISKKEWAKQVAIYHFLLPMMFQYASDGLDFRLKEQLRAAILGSFNGIFILGNILNAILSTALGLKAWQSSTIIDSVAREAVGAIKSLKMEDFSLESFYNVIKQSGDLAGVAKGLPFKQGLNILEGLNEMSTATDSEEFIRGFKRVAGWSEYVLDQGQNPSKGALR